MCRGGRGAPGRRGSVEQPFPPGSPWCPSILSCRRMSPGCGSFRVSCRPGVAGVWVRLPFRRVLSCEIGTAEGKPQVEGYGLEELAASAEAVLAGLGPLAAGLARLAADAGGAVTLDAMETLVTERGRELLRGVVQLALDAQADAEVRRAGVTGAD